MVRRQTDLSWPLILILFGLFLLSLKLPRPWEQIACESRLVIASHNAVKAEYTANRTAPKPDELLELAAYRVVTPAPAIGNQVTPATIALPATAPDQASEVGPSLELPDEPVVAKSASTGPELMSQPALPEPQAEPVVASAAPAATEQHPEVPPQRAGSSDLTFRRLPPLESVKEDIQPHVQPSETAAVDRPALPAAEAALPSPALSPEPSPLRAVVPEPQPIADAMPAPSAEPALLQPAPQSFEASPTLTPNLQLPPRRQQIEPNTIAEAPQKPVKAIGRAWEEPGYLLTQLDELKKHDGAREWATNVSDELRLLGPAIAVGAPQTAEILARLDNLARQAPVEAGKVSDDAVAEYFCGVGHALERRVTIWKQIAQMGGMLAADAPQPSVDPRSFNKALTEIEQLTDGSSEGHAWRKYLLVDSIREWTARRHSNDERMPHDLSQQVLSRMNQTTLNPHQRQFLNSGPVAALNREMLRHTAEPVESNRLLKHLETYEKTGLPSDARQLARDCEFLSVGSGKAQRELGERVEVHYRNANLRLAVSAELLNLFMPKREPEYAPVQDKIQGASVRGQSVASAELRVRMIPDPDHVRLALEVNGAVAASTRSTAGPATFYSDSESSYLARKPLEVTLRGIRMWPTEISVDNSSHLRGVQTDLQGVPIFGRIASNVSKQQYEEHRPAAEEEAKEQIAAKAKERIDRETTEQVVTAAKKLHDEILGPMDSLCLDPTLISAETNEKRFSMRIRLAGADQLGGYTPRPQAPVDSLASVQIHESMLNNILERLELDGETFDLTALMKRLSERLHRFPVKPLDPDQSDVRITFAQKDALHVRCVNGQMEITVSIARLSKGSRKFKDFQVRAIYKSAVAGRSIDLNRDGIVQLIGPRMNAGAQICLRGVFLKVFSQKEPIHVTPESFAKNPKLKGLAITQFVIEDGWIGAAIGAQQTAAVETAAAR